jgi:hypothetical protein
MYDFSNMGAGIDTEMGQNALIGQQIGQNLATAKDRVAATNAQNQAVASNAGLQVANNQRQQAFQMESAALSAIRTQRLLTGRRSRRSIPSSPTRSTQTRISSR